MKKSNYSYVGISFIILVFGIIFIPRIIERLKTGDITRNERMSKDKCKINESIHQMNYHFLIINGEKKSP